VRIASRRAEVRGRRAALGVVGLEEVYERTFFQGHFTFRARQARAARDAVATGRVPALAVASRAVA
jgi:hypothetical protein